MDVFTLDNLSSLPDSSIYEVLIVEFFEGYMWMSVDSPDSCITCFGFLDLMLALMQHFYLN